MITRDDMETMSRDEYYRRQNEQYEIFERLRHLVDHVLERFGWPTFLQGRSDGDYQVHGDYNEYPQVSVFVENLKPLQPAVIEALQQLLKEHPGWQVDLLITLPGHEDWPDMGLSVQASEIVDDLQRRHFPKEFQDIQYEGARRGSIMPGRRDDLGIKNLDGSGAWQCPRVAGRKAPR